MLTVCRHAVFLAMLLSVSLGIAGCSGDARDAEPDTLTTALAETRPAPPELLAMMNEVAEVRGLPPPATLRFGTVSRDRLSTLLDALFTDDDRKTFANTTTLYRLLGHLRPDQDYLSVYRALAAQSAIGLYSPAHDTLWIVDERPASAFTLEGLSSDGRAALAHEMVHAVQDANFPIADLRRLTKHDLDAGLALTSVLEGDAVTHQALYVARSPAPPQPKPPATAESRSAPSDVPPSISRELFFPYTTGAEWSAAIRDAGGPAAVDNLLRNLPTTTATVLHPELGTGRTPVLVTLPDLSQALGAGWSRESGGSFGEFQLRNYLQLRLPGIPAATAATGWDGDRYALYMRGSESLAVFRIAFADATQASEFTAAHETFLATGGSPPTVKDGLTITTSPAGTTTVTIPTTGREVTFVIGSSEAAATRAASLLRGS